MVVEMVVEKEEEEEEEKEEEEEREEEREEEEEEEEDYIQLQARNIDRHRREIPDVTVCMSSAGSSAGHLHQYRKTIYS